jgi:hypothetical protein
MTVEASLPCFRKPAPLCLTLTFVGGAGCTSAASGAPSGTTSAPAQAASDSKGCMLLDDMRSNCPSDWAGVSADREAFCSKRHHPSYSVFLSTAPCRGELHYVRYLFDAGPRHCLYDPVSRQSPRASWTLRQAALLVLLTASAGARIVSSDLASGS